MRKILFIRDEKSLPGALKDIQNLLSVERRLSGGSLTSDLIAIFVLSHQAVNPSLSQQAPHVNLDFLEGHRLFGPESVSMSGVWTLVTLTHPGLTRCSRRDDALVLLLNALQSQEKPHGLQTVFPVYSSEEGELLAGPPLPLMNSTSAEDTDRSLSTQS